MPHLYFCRIINFHILSFGYDKYFDILGNYKRILAFLFFPKELNDDIFGIQ